MLQKISPLQKCQEELGTLKAELEEKKVSEPLSYGGSLSVVRISCVAGWDLRVFPCRRGVEELMKP